MLNLEILLHIFDEAEIWGSPEEKPPPKDTRMWGILGGGAWEGLRLGGGLEAGVEGQPLEDLVPRTLLSNTLGLQLPASEGEGGILLTLLGYPEISRNICSPLSLMAPWGEGTGEGTLS